MIQWWRWLISNQQCWVCGVSSDPATEAELIKWDDDKIAPERVVVMVCSDHVCQMDGCKFPISQKGFCLTHHPPKYTKKVGKWCANAIYLATYLDPYEDVTTEAILVVPVGEHDDDFELGLVVARHYGLEHQQLISLSRMGVGMSPQQGSQS